MKTNEKYLFLTKKGFKDLISGIIKDFKAYGTVKKDGFPAFGRISSFEALELLQTPTHLSAKEFLFPQRETLLKFDMLSNTCEAVIEAEDQVIIGLHPCDIHAIALMDKVFACGKADPNYLAKREKTIIIGADCMPDKYCFCASLGTMTADAGFDLFIHKIKKGFLLRSGSLKGQKILTKYTKTRVAADKEIKELETLYEEKEGSFTTRLDAAPSALPDIYAKSNDSPVWERIGAICYGCGSCNNVCPTCYCFDVKDEVRADLSIGERVRVWDGCTLEDFAKVAGGHDFRKSRAERLKHRFNRKFRYLSDKFDSLFCVGCGRCSRTCLVKINIAEVTNELIHESEKK